MSKLFKSKTVISLIKIPKGYREKSVKNNIPNIGYVTITLVKK
jgi:hypothetical protein